MAESFIKRLQPDPDGLDFEGLRTEGIRLIQEVSGDIWTDYNLHDPGVTLLEAICYALTDLVYRTSFSAADYLANSEGKIDFKQQALHRPDEIFPCRPVTADDYRKLILNFIHNADNVWIRRHAAQTDHPHGLYDIYLLLSERERHQENDRVREVYKSEIRKVYAANRNLCEDLATVEIVQRSPYSVCGEIEIEGKRNPADILAEVYFECAQYLSPKISIKSHLEIYKSGIPLEDLLSGTLTEYGYIDDNELHPWRAHFSIPDLVGKIDRIDGVRNVIRLVFVDSEGTETDSIDMGGENSYLTAACLRFPPQDGDAGIKLYKTGKAYPPSMRDVETEYDRLDYKHQALRRQKQRFDWIDALLPKATFRNISDYYSLQNHFPDVYGLNAFGVPNSAPPQRKAQAMQLKAYLLFFEQIMANFLQNVQEIPRLFSLDAQLRQTSFYQVLGNDAVPNVEAVYQGDLDQVNTALGSLLAEFDHYGDRRNRVLDYLLGINGEKFIQASLQQFASESADVDDERIRNKIAFLKDIVDLNKNRAAAFNYHHSSSDGTNGSGLKKKLVLLLGCQSDSSAPSLETSAEAGGLGDDIHIVEHILLRPTGRSAHKITIPDDFYSFRISIVFPFGPARFRNREFRKLAEETIVLNCPAHIHAELFWPEAEQMQRFAVVHEKWLERKRAAEQNADEIDAAAESLIHFLLELGEMRNQ